MSIKEILKQKHGSHFIAQVYKVAEVVKKEQRTNTKLV